MFYHRYTLRSSGTLNTVSTRREFHGALIMVDGGVGCLHPWPEFGDPDIEQQLVLLRSGGTSRVIERALRMAQVDGEARKAGISLFAGLEIPLCHYSWDKHRPMKEQVRRLAEEGWRAVKVKGDKNPKETLDWLQAFVKEIENAGVRIDFNSCLTKQEFIQFVEAMPQQVKKRIDFIEDPFPYETSSWEAAQAMGIRLALDKQLSAAASGFDVAVLKPGRREWREAAKRLPEQVKVVLTSAMDHAVGQSFAAWEAACAQRALGSQRMELCGLCTEHLFAQDPFFERISSSGGRLNVDSKGTTGLGFDEVVKTLPWKPLSNL